MKNIKSLLLLLIISSLSFNACQKPIVFVEGSGPGGTTPTKATVLMSAKVNGILVNCESVAAQNDQNSGTLQINGTKAPEVFTFKFEGFKGPGTYNAADFTSFASYVNGTADPLLNIFPAESGTIKITKFTSTMINGTFDFKAINANGDIKTITEGVFVVIL